MGWISDLIINVSAFRIKIGEKLNKLWLDIGNKANLTTTNKNSLVEAVNEVKANAVPYTGADKPININSQPLTTSGDITKNNTVLERNIFGTNTGTTTNLRRYNNVAHYIGSNSTSAGIIKVVIPISNTTMWNAQISIQEYTNTALYRTARRTTLKIGGYSSTNTPRFVICDNPDRISKVEFGRDILGNTVIYIHSDSGSFSYERVIVDWVQATYSHSAGLEDKTKYSVSFIAEADIPTQDFTLNGEVLNSGFQRDSYYDYRRFGLGVTASVNKNPDDFNLLESGLYGVSTTATGNPIPGSSGTMMQMRSAVSGNQYWSQLYVMSNAGTAPRAFISHGGTSRVAPWTELATVSQLNTYYRVIKAVGDIPSLQYSAQLNLDVNSVLGNGYVFNNTPYSHIVSFGASATAGFQIIKPHSIAPPIVRTRVAGSWLADETVAYQSWADAKFALATSIPSGQLTVNTTSDLVGGYVYLPSGNVTTTLGLATHVLNAIVDGQTAYSWGDFRDFGLGRDTVAQGEVQISDPTATYVKSGFYAINPESNYPFSYGASIFGRKNNFEWLELVTNVLTGEFFLRNNITDLQKIWTNANFNPDSKVNNMENAVGIGFNNGSFSGLPYIFHNTGGYKFLATIEYINSQNYASVTYVNQQIANSQSPYKYESNNIKTVANGWQTYVGGRYNQALGDKITIKGNNLNYIGFNHVGSGALHAVLGNYNVSNGVLNNIVGNYSSANSNLINLIGNYLYSKQEGQSVYGNYNKITVPSNIPSKKVIHAFASGKSEYERDNAVEIFADNSTKARGRVYYDEQTRDEQWFENGTTLIDVNYLNSRINGDLQTDANSYDVCANNVLVVGVRKNTQTATDSEFQRINNENCFGVYGIAKGRYDVDADTSIMYYKDSFYIGASATAALASVVDKKPYLVVILDPKTMQFDSIQYLDIVTMMQNKQIGFVQIVLGSFVNHNADIYFEFNQQIIM